MKSSSVADEIRGRRQGAGADLGETRTPFRRTSVAFVAASVIIGGGLLGLIFIMMSPFSNHAASSEALAVDPKPAPIDGKRAFGYLEKICAIGPRIAGSEANTRQRNMAAAHFKAQGATVREQPFSGTHPLTGKTVKMVNLIASWNPERTERVVIGAHYDSRPFPDEEQDPELRRIPFIAANDGASGVALMMEMAHHLKSSPTPWGVDLVMFDGEELVYGREGSYCLGSDAFGRSYSAARKKGSKNRYVAGMVLDMVGGKDLILLKEPYSEQMASGLLKQVWSVAQRLDPPAKAFRDDFGREVKDDHLPLLAAGIETIDIIDFEYPHWHRATDLPENCSAASLEQVGRVVTGWLSLPKPPPRSSRKSGR
jgi:glutaminyl-peptide cyclotransferase